MRFDSVKLQGIGGRFFFVEKGKRTPAEYFGLELTVAGEKTEYIVGKDGEFYLENIPPGEHPARLFMKEKECRFNFAIPETEDIMIDMGEVSCEMR